MIYLYIFNFCRKYSYFLYRSPVLIIDIIGKVVIYLIRNYIRCDVLIMLFISKWNARQDWGVIAAFDTTPSFLATAEHELKALIE